VVGTAAGLVKPITGGGIYFGLLSADIAADVLGQAMERGDLSARALSLFQRRWKKKLGAELRGGSWGRAVFERLNDKQLDRAFEIVGRPGRLRRLLSSEAISFDWHSRVIADLLREQTLAKLIKGIDVPLAGKNRTRSDLS